MFNYPSYSHLCCVFSRSAPPIRFALLGFSKYRAISRLLEFVDDTSWRSENAALKMKEMSGQNMNGVIWN